MSKGYYLSINKEKAGPFEAPEIISWIQSGKITLFDMIFNQQMNQWMMVMQHPDFSDLEYSQAPVKRSDNTGIRRAPVNEGTFTRPAVPKHEVMVNDEISLLVPMHWFLKDEPQKPRTYLEVLSLINQRQVNEHTLISKNANGPWKKVLEWEEYSLGARAEFKKASKEEVPDVNMRRKNERHISGQHFVFLTKDRTYKIYCSDISKTGLGVIVRQELFNLEQEVYIRFADKVTDNNFDAKAIVVSSRKVKLPGSDEIFTRYGIRFTHMSMGGKTYIEELAAAAEKAAA
jgi:PilZ domain.